jgi:tetratricopeptide (TPR) repeat protein
MKHIELSFLIIVLLAGSICAQRGGASRDVRGGQSVYGDIRVDGSQSGGQTPLSLDLSLYLEFGTLVGRQTIPTNGRYRFNNLSNNKYYIVVELENKEIARFNVDLTSPLVGELRQDLEFQLRDLTNANTGVVSAADIYKRSPKTTTIFNKATDAVKNKQYDQAISLLREVVEIDAADFPAWTELGTVYFIQKNYPGAEKAYEQALAKQPEYSVALVSLGRLRLAQKNFDGAIAALVQAVKSQPASAQANYFLGEAYLQIRKGSMAVGFLNEAIKLDPMGMADAHLRLATLYNAAGMKDKASAEYEAFLKKRPDHPDRKKLEQYISENKPAAGEKKP